jgi:hypothetical protein
VVSPWYPPACYAYSNPATVTVIPPGAHPVTGQAGLGCIVAN